MSISGISAPASGYSQWGLPDWSPYYPIRQFPATGQSAVDCGKEGEDDGGGDDDDDDLAFFYRTILPTMSHQAVLKLQHYTFEVQRACFYSFHLMLLAS